MLGVLEIDTPNTLIGRDQTLAIRSVPHLYIDIVREAKNIPFIRISTNSARPTPLLTVKFKDVSVFLKIHPHEKEGVMELPTDWSLLNALQVYFKMQQEIEDEGYFESAFMAPTFHELFAPIMKARARSKALAG